MPKRVLMLKNLRLKIKSIIKTIRPSLKIRRLKYRLFKIRNGAYYGEYYNYDVIYDDGKPVCVITNYNPMSSEEKLEIPANIDGLDVISIADDAINYGGAKETVVPDTVKFIADNAFKESYSLENIYLTKNVSYIGKSAFKDSKDLTIHAPTDSYAHTFATENKINFKATDD